MYEKVVHVPQVQLHERLVEVPEIRVEEVTRYVDGPLPMQTVTVPRGKAMQYERSATPRRNFAPPTTAPPAYYASPLGYAPPIQAVSPDGACGAFCNDVYLGKEPVIGERYYCRRGNETVQGTILCSL